VIRSRLAPRVVGILLVVVGVLVLGAVGGYWGYRTWAVSTLDRFNKEPLPATPTSSLPLAAVIEANADATPPVRVVIPRIDLDSPIDQVGTEWKEAVYQWVVPDYNVGHPSEGTHPGQVGNSVMWGHLSTPVERKGSVFRRLPEVDPGDDVVVDTSRFRYLYRVSQVKVVTPEQVNVMETSPDPVLTLITCVPEWVYTYRLVVTAQLTQVLPLGPAGS